MDTPTPPATRAIIGPRPTKRTALRTRNGTKSIAIAIKTMIPEIIHKAISRSFASVSCFQFFRNREYPNLIASTECLFSRTI